MSGAEMVRKVVATKTVVAGGKVMVVAAREVACGGVSGDSYEANFMWDNKLLQLRGNQIIMLGRRLSGRGETAVAYRSLA